MAVAANKNPFVTGQPAKGRDFFGRQDVLRNVKSFLQNKNYHLLIFGQRRIGKTSLLKNIQDTFKSKTSSFLYYNLQDKANVEVSNLIKNLLSKISKQTKSEYVFENEINYCSDFAILSSRILENSAVDDLIILFDEFDVMYSKERTDEFVNIILNSTEYFSEHQTKIKFIYAFGDNYSLNYFESDFFSGKKIKTLNLTDFEPITVNELVGLSKELIPFEQAAVKTIYELTGGNPFFIQCLAYKSFDYAENLHSKNITEKMVRRQFVPAIKSYGNGVATIWNSLLNEDKILLFIVAKVLEIYEYVDRNNFEIVKQSLGIKLEINQVIPRMNFLKRNKFLRTKGINRFGFENEFIRKWILLSVKKSEII